MAWLTNKKTGARFNTDWIEKEKQIERNKEQADIRNKSPRPMMRKDYKEVATATYKEMSQLLKNTNISSLDISNVTAVKKLAEKLLDNSNGKYCCYNTAATIAAVMDKKGVTYKCYSGVAASKDYLSKKPVPKEVVKTLGANHVWIESNNIVYEKFDGQGNNIVHLNITDEIIFNKKK